MIPAAPLGFGAATLGGLFEPMTDEQSGEVLEAAWEAGIRYFDTAPHYGAGLSEERLGRFLAGKPRDEFVLSTKVGRLLVPREGPPPDGVAGFYGAPNRDRVFDFSRDGVLRSLAESLERLGLDRVDIVFIHDPDDHEEQALHEAYPALARLRDEGVVSSVGVGMNQTRVPARFVRETDIDCLLIAGRYTLLDAQAGEELLPLCEKREVDVVCAGVFNSGLLAAPLPGATYDYAPAPDELYRRARRIAEVCARCNVSPAAAAIAFARSHPAVRTVLVGMRNPAEVRQNTAAATATMPPELWAELSAEGLLPS
ncbi:aldo/keto reductase [Amycolatopsis taiwanensis]|uniref:Oxidoreductase n=1 Tax=Amycolatopsis taiwanensis TaxID=342230 RepID=A0A9W6R7K6_9PSEU|nr:aldo/keto reductase [Amycolatopsis taiwanensis]GLY70849.1 oxidoreductase [Amycolatopsis taiwanensis]